jgi:signal transduction histidine kinase
MWIGNIYKQMGFRSKALEYLFKASETAPSKKTQQEILYYTSLVYYNLNEIEKCRDYAKQCLIANSKNKNSKININTYILLSNTYNNFDSINLYLNKAYNIVLSGSNMQYTKAIILNNQALLYDMVGKTALRDKKYQEAINIAKKNNFISYLPVLYNNYSYALMEEKKFDSAFIILDTSLSIAQRNKNLDIQASLYDTYSDLYKEMGDYKKALKLLRKSIRKREAFKNQQQVQTSLFLSVVFETQKKEKELLIQEAKLNRYKTSVLIGIVIILLLIGVIFYFRQKISMDKIKLENLEKEKSLEIADALIKGQDEERKRLAMDLHDGLGARLGALKLKVDTVLYDNPNYYDLTSAIDGIARNVRELSHRMLPSRLAEVGLVHSLKNLIRSVNASADMTIEFETNLDYKLDDKYQVHLYYLIYELINNAIKHSEGNILTIQLFIDKESLTLSAEDDGVGFDVSEKGEGHGLNNIKQRVDYLGGRLIIESEKGHGSVFMIEIPVV